MVASGSIRELVLDEFQVKRLNLKHNNLADFVCSQVRPKDLIVFAVL